MFDLFVVLSVAVLTTLGLTIRTAPEITVIPGYVMSVALLVRRRWPLTIMGVVGAAALAQVVLFSGHHDPLPYDVAVEVSVAAVSRVLAAIHENEDRAFPILPHSIDMFVDEKHPTIAGTYLSACVMYKTIYHKPATGLPTTVPGMKLDPQLAALLQRVADGRSPR